MAPYPPGKAPSPCWGVRIALKQATWLLHLFPGTLDRVGLGRFRRLHWMYRRCAARGDWLREGTLRAAYAMRAERLTIMESRTVTIVATDIAEMTVEELRLRVGQLETENAALRPIVLRMAEARMCRDAVTMIESCLQCSLKRGGAYGYSGAHDADCPVAQARALGF